MSSTGEVKNLKPAKEKKAKVPAAKKAKSTKTASHPPYFQMIKEALLALNEKGGSSPYAIGKYMEDKHKAALPENFRKMLALQLKNSATKGKLIKVKASYKLSGDAKKAKTPVVKKATPAVKKATAVIAKAKKGLKTTPVKKGKKMKMTPAKAKQPKSIKSPAAKKARKATA